MTRYARYTFDQIDTATGTFPDRRQADRRKITDADIERARSEGYEAGKRDALAAAAQAEAQALNAIARLMQMQLGGLSAHASSLREDAVAVITAASRLAAGTLLDLHGGQAVEAFFAEAISQMRDTPQMTVLVAPDLVEQLTPKLQAAAARHGLEAMVHVVGDPAAAQGDCRISWPDGAIHHDRAAAFASIEAACSRWLAAADQSGMQLDMFSEETAP